jgi:SAM-dependent methyltransferase
MEALEGQPDVETSSAGYARRFAGPVGEWFLDLQARTTLELLHAWPRASVLDVGGGHGQVTGPLADAGYDVTVFGSAEACRERVRGWVDAGRARFRSGDLLALPFGDATFDACLCYRLLPHLTRWPRLVAELCRVTRRVIVIDYPTRRSVNAAAGALFGLKRGVEGNTRPFLVFRDAEIEAAFAAAGYAATARRPQFFLPMALHRTLGAVSLSRGAEAGAAALGLTRAFGSPVILRLEPDAAARGGRPPRGAEHPSA